MSTDESTCPENENSTDCLLRALLMLIDDQVKAEDAKVDWDPITFAFTVPVGIFGILAAIFALVTIFQAALASGPGRRKSSKQAIGEWSQYTDKIWNWHELNRLSIARTPVLRRRTILHALEGTHDGTPSGKEGKTNLAPQEERNKQYPVRTEQGTVNIPSPSVSRALHSIIRCIRQGISNWTESLAQTWTAGREDNQQELASSDNTSAATWLDFLRAAGLQDLKTEKESLQQTAADFLPDDLRAVPAYGEVGCIIAMAAAAGMHSLQETSESPYPIIIGNDFQFDFRVHPVLGTVGAFARYGLKRKIPNRSRNQVRRVMLALRHANGEVEITTLFKSEGNAKIATGDESGSGLSLLRRTISEGKSKTAAEPTAHRTGTKDEEGESSANHSQKAGQTAPRSSPPDEGEVSGKLQDQANGPRNSPEAGDESFMNVLSLPDPERIITALHGHGCDGHRKLCCVSGLFWRGDVHHLLWLLAADTPTQIPTIFPSQSTGVHNLLTVLALQSRFWARPRAELQHEAPPSIIPNQANGLSMNWDVDLPLAPSREELDLMHAIANPKEDRQNLYSKFQVFFDSLEDPTTVYGFPSIFEACLRFLYTYESFGTWFRSFSELKKQCFRTFVLAQIRQLDKWLKAEDRSAVGSVNRRKLILYLNTTALLDARQAITDNTFGLMPDNIYEKYGLGEGFLDRYRLRWPTVKDTWIVPETDILGLHLDMLQVLGPLVRFLQQTKYDSYLWKHVGFREDFKKQLRCLSGTDPYDEDFDWQDMGLLFDSLDDVFQSCETVAELYPRKGVKPEVAIPKSRRSYDYTVANADDVLVWRCILLAMLFWTVPDNSKMLISGLWEHIIPII